MLPVTDMIEAARPPRTAASQWFDHWWNYLRIETLSLAKSRPSDFRGIPGMPLAAQAWLFLRHPTLRVAL